MVFALLCYDETVYATSEELTNFDHYLQSVLADEFDSEEDPVPVNEVYIMHRMYTPHDWRYPNARDFLLVVRVVDSEARRSTLDEKVKRIVRRIAAKRNDLFEYPLRVAVWIELTVAAYGGINSNVLAERKRRIYKEHFWEHHFPV